MIHTSTGHLLSIANHLVKHMINYQFYAFNMNYNVGAPKFVMFVGL